MSRPRFIATEEMRQRVLSMAAYGTKQEDIAISVGAQSPKTLRKYFASELRRGAIDANAQVAQTLYKMATSGACPAATIFWAKTRLHWREIQIVENHVTRIPDFIVERDKEAA